MRGECKYAHECRYQRYVNGKERTVARTECWAVKEPFERDAKHKELCGVYKLLSCNDKLFWIPTNGFDEHYGYTYKCNRCGEEIIGMANYCPNCGYEYEPWDGTILGKNNT